MKSIHHLLRVILPLLAFTLMPLAAGAAPKPPEVGKPLPEIVLPAPQKAEYRSYLGIDGKETFRIPDIQARVVVIEILNMY